MLHRRDFNAWWVVIQLTLLRVSGRFSVSVSQLNSRRTAAVPRVVHVQVACVWVRQKALEYRCGLRAFTHFGVDHHVRRVSKDALRAKLMELNVGFSEQRRKQIGRQAGVAK